VKKTILLSILFIIISAVLGLLVHEFIGHGLTCLLLGGKINSFGFLTNGSVGYISTSGLTGWQNGVMLLMGTLSTLILGILILLFRQLNLFLWWFGFLQPFDFIMYALTGAAGLKHWIIIGGVGEPQKALALLGLPTWIAAVLALIALVIPYIYLRRFKELQQK